MVYSVVALAELRKVLGDCSQRSVGLFGDAYSTMAVNWVMTRQSFPPWQNRTQFTGYPEGESFWTFDWWTSTLVRIPQYTISLISGPVCAYNIMVLLGLIFSASCAWLLAHKVTQNNFISILAGLMFGFGPYAQSKISGHINYTFIGVYPLLIFLLLKLISSKRSTSVWIGITLGCFSYVDGYFFVPTVFLVGTFLVLNLVDRKFKKFNFKIRASFFVAYALSQTPLVYLFMRSLNSGGDELPARDWNELNVYAIKLWHFFVPHRDNMYLGSYLTNWAEKNLGGSNFSETYLFPGYTFISLALVCIILISRNRKRFQHNPKLQLLNREDRSNLKFLLSMAFFGVFLSFRPIVNFLGLVIPFPSGIVFYFAPYFRTISRWGVITTISVIVIGALGFKLIVKGMPRTKRRIFYGLIAVLVFVDLGIPNSLSPRVESVIQERGPYHWVSQNTDRSSVILDLVPYSVDNFFFGHLLSSERRMANNTRPPKRSYQEALFFPERSDFTCALSKAGVNYLIFHPEMNPEEETLNIKGMIKVFEYFPSKDESLFEWKRAEVFKVENSTKYLYESQFDKGFEIYKEAAQRGARFLNQISGKIELQNSFVKTSQPKNIAYLQLSVVGKPEFVSVQVNGSESWRGVINSSIEVPIKLIGTGKYEVKVSRFLENQTLDKFNLKVEFQNNCRS